MADGFRALRIHEADGRTEARVETLRLADLSAGEVVVRVAYSSVNYKDALAVTGAGKVIRGFPRVAGIDCAGTVLESSDPRWRAGEQVICTSYDFGVSHDGGLAEIARVKGDWVVPLPEGLSLFDAMALGTAGYTAGLAIDLAQANGLAPDSGKVLVNGATGGVATLCIDMLSRLGHTVVALTGKAGEREWLTSLGAAEVLLRDSVDMGTRPLEKALWAGAFDSVGGEQLGWLTRTMQSHGVIAAFGNAGGIEFRSTVLPFILRGVRLIGVDSAYTPMPLRRRVWERLATDLRPRHLGTIARVIGLDEVRAHCDKMIAGGIRGRAVVKLA